MSRSVVRSRWAGLSILLGMLLVASLVSIRVGAVRTTWSDLVSRGSPGHSIIYDIRLPRVILAGLVGATLAIAGATFQTLLRNPLADPFILGVSGGAACGAAVSTALGLARYPGIIPLVAFAGACAAVFAVFVLARRHGRVDSIRLILAGLVLNSFFSALILLSLSLSDTPDLTAALRWMMGSFFSATWRDVLVISGMFVVSLVILLFIAGDLRMFTFGEDDAKSRGVSVERIKLIAFFAASLATGAAVAVSGIIGFVGLLVPHAIRAVWRQDFRTLLPLSGVAGAALLVSADALSRTVIAPQELPISAITALLGVPFFLVMLRRSL